MSAQWHVGVDDLSLNRLDIAVNAAVGPSLAREHTLNQRAPFMSVDMCGLELRLLTALLADPAECLAMRCSRRVHYVANPWADVVVGLLHGTDEPSHVSPRITSLRLSNVGAVRHAACAAKRHSAAGRPRRATAYVALLRGTCLLTY
jgi:hypothetical protein